MRGVFTAGVLDYFLEQDIQFDTCIGVSAGSCLACSYLSKQHRRGYRTITGYLDPQILRNRQFYQNRRLFWGRDAV